MALEGRLLAVTLVDGRTGMFSALLPSDRGRFRLVHSGDVKVYENLDVLPRAYLVHQAIPVRDRAEALNVLSADHFDPTEAATVEGGTPLQTEHGTNERAEIIRIINHLFPSSEQE